MKILIAYDGSDFANAILDDLRYAGFPQRAEISIITLAEPEYFLVGKKTDGVMEWLSCRLIEARMSARLVRDRIQVEFPGWDVTFEARLAQPPQEITRKTVEWNPDLIIIGQHGRAGLKRTGLGRVAKRLFKEAKCSVRIARARRQPRDARPRIIIPLAASQNHEATARAVMSRSWPPGTEVKLIACIGPILNEMRLARGILDPLVETVMDIREPIERKLLSANLLVTSEVMAGFSSIDVIEVARRWRADCIFIGAEKTSYLEKLFSGGPVASVAARAECSVEIVRSQIRCDARVADFAARAKHNDSLPVAR